MAIQDILNLKRLQPDLDEQALGRDFHSLKFYTEKLDEADEGSLALIRSYALSEFHAQYSCLSVGPLGIGCILEVPNEDTVKELPVGSFVANIPFKLARPLISRGVNPFHVHENPLAVERVFQVPSYEESGLKGCLRSAYYRVKIDSDGTIEPKVRVDAIRLFGSENVSLKAWIEEIWKREPDEFPSRKREFVDLCRAVWDTDEPQVRGTIELFPLFFSARQVEVLNPRDRKSGKGTFPIHIDAVSNHEDQQPVEGKLIVLCIPFDQMSLETGRALENSKAIAPAVLRALDDMGQTGIGGKKKAGYGALELAATRSVLWMRAESGVIKGTWKRWDPPVVEYVEPQE